jgi:hypothetical protein
LIGDTGGSKMEVHMKMYSPMLKSIRIVEKGSGKLRSRLNYIRDLIYTDFKALKKVDMRKFKKNAKEEEKRLRYKLLIEDGFKV